MYKTGIENENNSTSLHAALINTQNYVNQHQSLNNSINNKISTPTCIVIGCKNGGGNSNSSVKYYQVPNLQTNNIARQWYINTLREDLFDNLVTNNQTALIQPHYVCIEHFDEENFTIGSSVLDSQQQIMILKNDAVPSLFEIEVFQKMIAYQEQISLNQQKQQKQLSIKQQQQQQQPVKQHQPSSLLSSLILSEQPTVFSTLTTSNNRQSLKTNSNNNLNKRPRIDPDVRAALIQRVPKAVKRTSVLSLSSNNVNNFNDSINKLKITDNSVNTYSTNQPIKLPKAVKHTIPRNLNVIDQNQTQQNYNQATTLKSSTSPSSTNNNNHNNTIKNNKQALKNSIPYLKDIPPPIMQSTKRTSVNKAVKHTSGLSQNFSLNNDNKLINNLNTVDLSPSTSLLNLIQNSQNDNLSKNNSTTNNNKITITTTYVYKKISQQPEIDLELECEEEEYIYIKSKSPSLSPSSQVKSTESSDSSKLKDNKQPDSKDDKKSQENINEKSNLNENKSIQSAIITKIAPKSNIINKSDEPEVDQKSSHINAVNKKSDKKSSNEFTEKLNNNSSSSSATTLNNVFMNVLSKYYSRQQGFFSMEKNTIKKNIPNDLRIGNYPAKCNICDLILENNIELTSHICSHLESNGNDSNNLNSYISPFDAVTTTCGVCDETFSQPFELIKHLDMKHMKQLDEYKCRICEKQHSKLTDLVTHLSRIHLHQEMPYRCDACGFRTSFYADAIYHIKKEHTSTLRHFCPYCLKSLVLPYNEKLGYVQCNLFYAHLETHFNKQENNILLPCKCKHCNKCILHVRNMKDHLSNDHNDNSDLNVTSKTASNEKKQQYDKRKRKRSIKEEEYDATINDENSNSIISQDNDDEDNLDIIIKSSKNKTKLKTPATTKEIKIEKEDTENSTSIDVYDFEENNHIESIKLKGRRSSVSKKPPTMINNESNISMNIPQSSSLIKKPKAIKQTNIKKNLNNSARRSSRSSRTLSTENNSNNESPMQSEDKIISTLLLGNLKFSCHKSKFKCIECNGTDMKCHYRNEYTCHQCYYNTSCSKSFEYHLHGHLVSKRVALWNKKIKSELIEVYNCPCGFKINSSLDNNSNGDTGNKVAVHLMQCEYKYCNFKTIDQKEEKEKDN